MLPHFNAKAALGAAARRYPGVYLHGSRTWGSGQGASPAAVTPSQSAQSADSSDEIPLGEEIEADDGPSGAELEVAGLEEEDGGGSDAGDDLDEDGDDGDAEENEGEEE